MNQLPETSRWLADLVRIPSVSAHTDHTDDCHRSARRTSEMLRDAGLDAVRVVGIEGSHPYVIGSWTNAGPDAPTVLLYAHHDVQPVAAPERWASAPFEPTSRHGRLYGRGAADDKAGILAHIAAIRAWLSARDTLPVNVHVLIDGEEEIGSPSLSAFLELHGEQLQADVIILTDLANWDVGWPGLTYALRGSARLTVTVRTLAQPVHSGLWGGAVPDALTATVALLATLHDDRGAIAVDHFLDDVRPLSAVERQRTRDLGADAEQLRRAVRLLDGVDFVGDDRYTLLERTWMQPTITPVAMDVPSSADASNALSSEVRTELSCRLAPGQDPDRALLALRRHLETHAPWGAHVEVRLGRRSAAWIMEPEGPAWDAGVAALTAAYGHEPAALGCGGSIPFVGVIGRAFPGVPCLLIGVEDPASNAHGDDESLYLEDFTKACLAEAFLLSELAGL